jgi:hypothetical protein
VPLSASSHWLFGNQNIKLDRFDPQQTLTTHHASSIFWALVYEFGAVGLGPNRSRGAAAGPTAVFAAFLDYGLLPRRLTPGWELALSKRSVSAGFLLLGLGLALGHSLMEGRTKG